MPLMGTAHNEIIIGELTDFIIDSAFKFQKDVNRKHCGKYKCCIHKHFSGQNNTNFSDLKSNKFIFHTTIAKIGICFDLI